MPSDPTKPLIRVRVERPQDRAPGRPNPSRIERFTTDRQTNVFAPKFNRLAEVLERDPTGLELRRDPTALAPERVLVFEVRGEISRFAAAINRIPGLELIDEEEIDGDDEDKAPVAYLTVPDAQALRELHSLWQRWQSGRLIPGETPWRDVFSLLRDLRPWGPSDRVTAIEADILTEEIEGRGDNELVALEVELVFRSNAEIAQEHETEIANTILSQNGQIVSRCRLDDICYHALLVRLPVIAIREIIQKTYASLAGLDPVMHIRPQSIATSIEVEDGEQADVRPSAVAGNPILAVLDGVPVGAHALLAHHVIIEDLFDLEGITQVQDRVHGTAISSLIVHGDRNAPEASLPRPIHLVPVLGPRDEFPSERLIIDLIYQAVVGLRDGENPSSPDVLIVNISLGNVRRRFFGQLSPWARLLDRLAYKYGILFIVSAGNYSSEFGIPAYRNGTEFEDAAPDHRAGETLRAIGNIIADRRLLSPAETVNGITVGACNFDNVAAANRASARTNVDPYGEIRMANPSSALGPGFALSVKPDILMPGARERLRFVRNNPHTHVEPAKASRSAGLKVAAPPAGGREGLEGYANGTSSAAALASRTAHRIHDALEAAYGEDFLSLSHMQKAVVLKALLVHTASWPEDAANLIRDIIGPSNGQQHVRLKDNIRRFLGFGCVAPDDAVACAEDRATLWAVGSLAPDKMSYIEVPVPVAMSGHARPHSLSATLAWLTPTLPGRKSYRSVRLKLIDPDDLTTLRVQPSRNQPDGNQTNRGTIFMRRWEGDRAPVVGADSKIRIAVQRNPDQGPAIDDHVPFGVAITLTMPGVDQIYEQVRERVSLAERARA